MLIIRFRICLLLIALCVAGVTRAAPDIEKLKNSLVTVIAKSGGIQHQSVGIVLGNEQVLAIRPEQKSGLQFNVKPWSSDAVLLAKSDAMNEKMDDQLPFMVLHVPGLQLSAAGFLVSETMAGLAAYSPIARGNELANTQGASYEIKRGALAEVLEFQPVTGVLFKKPKGPILHLVSHNVLITAEEFGTPVVNECGQVIAVSMADPRLNKTQRRQNPQDAMVALLTSQLIQWLQAAEIEVNVIDGTCLSVEQQAQEAEGKAQEAEDKAQEAEDKAQEAEDKAQEAEEKRVAAEEKVGNAEEALREALSKATTNEEQKAVAQQALQQAKNALESASRNAETAQAEIEGIKEDAAQQRLVLFDKIKLYGGIAIGGLLIILLLWLMSNRKKKTQIKTEREKAAQYERKAQDAIAQAEIRLAPFDCILDGEDKDGKRYLLKLHKVALGDADGVVLGRNPRNATFIIGHEAISREHARLYIDDNMLYVHDLESANATRVNGKVLQAKDSVRLVNGATLDIGPIKFKVKLIS